MNYINFLQRKSTHRALGSQKSSSKQTYHKYHMIPNALITIYQFNLIVKCWHCLKKKKKVLANFLLSLLFAGSSAIF